LLSAALSGTQTLRTFVPEKHTRLQAEEGMLHHLGGVLKTLHLPGVESLRDARDGATAWFSLDVDDVFLPGEPVSVRVQALSGHDTDTLPTRRIHGHRAGRGDREVAKTVPVSDVFATAAPAEVE